MGPTDVQDKQMQQEQDDLRGGEEALQVGPLRECDGQSKLLGVLAANVAVSQRPCFPTPAEEDEAVTAL